MSSKIKTFENQLICTSFPRGVIALVVIFYLVGLAALINADQSLEFIDYVIFHAVLLIAVSIQQYVKTTFNLSTGEVKVTKKGIFNKNTTKFTLLDIKSIDMSYGRGSGFASGGAIVITTSDERINIASSDIIVNSAQTNEKNLKVIYAFLGLD
jgi:hypothetical protein